MKKFFVLSVMLLVFSCHKKEKIPDNILSEVEMADLLIDIRIAEGKVGTLTLGKDSSTVIFKTLEKQIFEAHGIDSTIYVKSHNYYLLHPESYMRITDIVIDSLKYRNDQLIPSATMPDN